VRRIQYGLQIAGSSHSYGQRGMVEACPLLPNVNGPLLSELA